MSLISEAQNDVREMMKEEGMKYDHGKPRTDLIPPTMIWAMGKVFAYGADKYTDRNWEQGIDYSRLFGALQRHLWAFWQGEECDPESGLPHLAHAACSLAMLLDTAERMPERDDRPDYRGVQSPYEQSDK